MSNLMSNTQIYWAGPILGGVTAALLYCQLFKAPTASDASERYRTSADDKEVMLNLMKHAALEESVITT